MGKSGKKKKLGSYPSASVVFSITLALFVIGLFGTLLTFTRELERVVQENIRIQVYLKKGIGKEDIAQIKKKLTADSFINQSVEAPITFIARDDAAKKFIKETGEDFYQFMGENPLHDSFILAVAPAFQSSKSLRGLKSKIEKYRGVHYVDYNPNLIESINQNRNVIAVILLGCAAVLFAVSILLIRNTLRLALFSQRFLIRSMQLVGATNGFITKPFLKRSALYGLSASLIASALLIGLVTLAIRNFPEVGLIVNERSILTVLASVALLGIFVAVSSTWFAVRKYLALSLDQLY
ncbi:MAG: ABC transporter permease [Bacteroidetes bacterium]|nr:ABC transporter permease [Bacteroidota bacterium]